MVALPRKDGSLAEVTLEPGRVTTVCLDLDGVVWLAEEPLPGASEAIRQFRASGRRVLFVSNNSLLSRRMVVRRLGGMGIEARDEDVYVSTFLAARSAAARFPGGSVHVLGSEGLREEVREARLSLCSSSGACDCALVGVDPGLSYDKLVDLLRHLHEGVPFIATDSDAVYPRRGHPVPGGGAVLAAVEAMAGRKADVVVGKPNPTLFDIAMRHWGFTPREALFVGDSIGTDYALAQAVGCPMVLVLTGNTSQADARALDPAPARIVAALSDVPRVLA